jgi:hypothetical protein
LMRSNPSLTVTPSSGGLMSAEGLVPASLQRTFRLKRI